MAKPPKGFKASGSGFIPSKLGASPFKRGTKVNVTKVGQWKEAKKILSLGPFALPKAIERATKQEGQFLRKMIVKNLTQQGAIAGRPFKPHKESTKLSRKFRRRPTGKVLIDRADMRNSISVQQSGDRVFVGILRTARGKDGRPLAKVGRVHEFGQTIAVPVTKAMLRFLHVMFRKGGVQRGQGNESKALKVGETLVIKIEARPFIRPVVDKFYSNPAIVRSRFNARLGALLGGQFGSVVASGSVKL